MSRRVDTTKTRLNRENFLSGLFSDEYFAKLDPEKVATPKTKEHRIYRWAKNMNVIKEERLTEQDFKPGPEAPDRPNKVDNTVIRHLSEWEVFKNVPRFRYFAMAQFAKIWRRWDPARDHLMTNDNPHPRSLSYLFQRYAYSFPVAFLRIYRALFNLWSPHYTGKIPVLPTTSAHENGVFLFQAQEANGWLRARGLEALIGFTWAGLLLTPDKWPALILALGISFGGVSAAGFILSSRCRISPQRCMWWCELISSRIASSWCSRNPGLWGVCGL